MTANDDSRNPYAPPRSVDNATEEQRPSAKRLLGQEIRVWRDGTCLIVPRGYALPDRCVVCNRSADPRRIVCHVKRHVSPTFILLMILIIGPLVPIALTMCLPSAVIRPGLCSFHRGQEIRARLVTVGIFFLGVVLLIFSLLLMDSENTWPIWLSFVGILTLLLSPLFAAFRVKPLKAKKIDKQFVWLMGIHPDYVLEYGRELPE